MEDLNKYIQVAKQAALAGGRIAEAGFFAFKRSQTQEKKGHELFTKYDLASEAAIRKIIKRHFPRHRINGEEKGFSGRANDYVWQIDPIDGTTNFTIHDPNFAVSIGLEYRGHSIVGVIYVPVLKELFWAGQGKGAWLGKTRIKVSSLNNLKRSIITFNYSHYARYNKDTVRWKGALKLLGYKAREMGSAAVNLAWVASGRLEGTVASHMGPWDFSAGCIIAAEAGAKITDRYGRPVKRLDRPVIVSNGLIHSALLKLLNN